MFDILIPLSMLIIVVIFACVFIGKSKKEISYLKKEAREYYDLLIDARK